ncbi:MAG: universal stress protein [Yoonia sp.]|nr:universal stress protein [Yoonia sp.]
MNDKILIATDGSEIGNRALDCAAELSARLGYDLCIMHVLLHDRPSDELTRLVGSEHLAKHFHRAKTDKQSGPISAFADVFPDAADETARARAMVVLGDLIVDRASRRAQDAGAQNVTTRVCVGDCADEILDMAECEKPKMIVLGRRGLGRVRETLLGSVSQKVLHHAPCTVVIAQ